MNILKPTELIVGRCFFFSKRVFSSFQPFVFGGVDSRCFCQDWSENNGYGHRPSYIAEGLIVHTHICQPCDDILAMQMFATVPCPPPNSNFYLGGGIFFPE